MLLGGTPHNRPLFIEGFTRGQKLKRILVDQGSAVNIMSLRAMKDLGISTDELTQSRLMIQGFNQGGQRAIGIVRLDLRIGSLSSSVLCHVIEARTSYNLLLGRPWIHENRVVPSSWHQCLIFEKNGVAEKVVADESPFTEAESYFADAKFYVKKVVVEDVEESNGNPPPQLKSKGKQVVEGDQHDKELIFPLAMIDVLKADAAKPPEEKGCGKGGQVLPTKRTEGFDPNAYKLLAKAGYNPNEPQKLGKLIPEAGGKGKSNQQEPQSRKGLGYVPPRPVRILINRATSNCISAEENEHDHELTPANESRRDKKRSVFDRMGKVESRRSVFDRLGSNSKTAKRKSIHDRLGAGQVTEDNASHPIEEEPSKRLRSVIPSRMRRETDIHVSCGDVLKVQQRTIVHTRVPKEEDEESIGSCYEKHQTVQEEGTWPLEEVASSFHITLCDEVPAEGEDAEEAPHELEEGVRAAVDELKEVDLGTPENHRPIFISTLLSDADQETYITLLKEYIDVFAWTYKEMPGLDPKVAVHRLAVKRGCRPVKQAQRRFRPELIPSIEGEVNKLIEAGFIREVKYPTWISSIVPVRKKNGQIRVCVDFRDLNVACPKDDFPLPITELMIDAVTGHEIMSFMDGSSGYNQIRMAPEDEDLTAFRTPKGIYCYKVMPFGLKNAGATYQRAMQTIFDDMLHKMVECYVDDLVVKSKLRTDHLAHLRQVFDRLRKFQLKMNPLKCAFGVAAGKFLGFTVRHRGVEIEQAKIDAIMKMPEPRNLHELKSLQGKLAYIRRFISNLAGRCQPFSRLMKKGVPFIWDEACKNAFESIKLYLTKPPVLTAPVHGRPLILYISAQESSVGALLAQENDNGKENALYYLSRMMTPNELKYSPIEKLCLALIFAIKKLKHYFEAHTIRLVSRANPVKYVMTKVVLSDRLARWYLLFQQFEIVYVPQKSVKGQALADFLADHPIPAEWELSDDLPDEDVLVIEVLPPWKMYFDGASHREGAGAGVVFVTPEGEVLPYSFALTEQCSNNVAEYQALILGLEIAVDMKQLRINVYGDSKLVVNQVLGLYEVKKAELVPYNNYAKILMQWLGDATIEHIPRKANKQADALAALASTIAHPQDETRVRVCKQWIVPPIFNEDGSVDETVELPTASVYEIGEDDWRQPLIDYFISGKLPEDPRKRVDIRRRAPRFIYYKETLYRRSFEGVFLRCLGEEEALQAMEEAHSGVCGAHQSGPKLHFHIKRMGYYWPTMVKDCMDYARRCQACQIHANFIHQPPEPLHPTVASWPFDAWGLDVVGPITPKSSAGHSYILAATDYFSKWAEAVALKEVKKENVADFLRVHIIYRFGIPRYILTDNGKPFDNKLMDKICKLFDFKQRNSSAYYAAANGLAEAFNKTLCNLLKKVVSKSKRDWHDRMEEALWAYRTTYRTPTQSTPYSLVYGVEAVLPLERQIPSLRLAIQEGLTNEENAKLRLAELEALDEKRLQAQQSLECYQARMSRAFNKRVRIRSFQVGDKVLAVRRPIIVTRKTGHKFTSRWDGPYVVHEVYTGGAYKLINEDGSKIGPINGRFLKLYHP